MKRFLIIGLGSIGRRHTGNLSKLYPNSDFTFLRRNNEADPLVSEVNGRIVTDFDAALERSYDLVLLSTPSALHIDFLPRLIASGFNLLIEKPVVTELEDCQQILEQLNSEPAAIRACAFNLRYVESIGKIRQLIQAGKLGTVVRANLTAGLWLPDWRVGQDYRVNYSARREMGGGVELDIVHEIDLARFFFGELDFHAALGGKLSALEISSNDTNISLYKSSRTDGPFVVVNLDYVSRQRVRRYEIVGDDATLLWDINGKLELISAQGKRELISNPQGFDISPSYEALVTQVIGAIDGNQQMNFQSLEDGLSSTRLAILSRNMGSIK